MQTETLPPGTILHGRYRIERTLGSGGFGHVYLSIDLQTNAQYAVKEYLVTGASGKAQLEHEAQVLSHLRHPSLPALLAAFEERGHYYVVLGYIEGNDLTDYVRVIRQKNEVIPLACVMEWLISICDAVSFLHSQHPPIIHRDIKPDNIRITPSGTAILVDLGNAKTAADGARTLFFIRHQGTPGYAPLEQYPGGSGTDERSDIYALGGTLYFLLTAHEPHSVSMRNQALQQKQPDLPSLQDRLAKNPPDTVQEARQFRLGVSKPAKPVQRHSRHLAQLGTLPPELLRSLDAIIQRAMAMKPKDRYQSVASFSNDLRAVLQALPTSTVPPAASNRPVDPHSTQPDLPMLYEAMQNAQAAANQPATKQTVPAQPASPATPGQTATRCPRCGAELNRPAPYCPRCGNPLTPQPPTPKNAATYAGQNIPQIPVERDVSQADTLLIPPRAVLREMSEQKQQPGSPSAQALQQGGSFLTLPPAGRQPLLKTHEPAQTTQAQSGTSQIPAKPAVKPFMASVSPDAASGPAQAVTQGAPSSATTSRSRSPNKLLLILAVVIVVLILIMVILLLFMHYLQHSLRNTAFNSEIHYTVLKTRALFGQA